MFDCATNLTGALSIEIVLGVLGLELLDSVMSLAAALVNSISCSIIPARVSHSDSEDMSPTFHGPNPLGNAER